MLYNKYYASNYEELITYYPQFYRDVIEMDAILRAEGSLADDVQSSIELVFNNHFIDNASEEIISRWETFLNLRLQKSRTLEERRALVKAFLMGWGKVSASSLESMIKAYTGAEVEITLEPFDEEGNNRLEINIARGSTQMLYMADIIDLVSRRIPAHIEYRLGLVFRYPVGVGWKRTHYLFDYDLAGTKPEITTLGLIIKSAAVVKSNITNYKRTYMTSSETEQAGKEPDVATLGQKIRSAAAVESNITSYTRAYPTSSENEQAGGIPAVSTLGQKIESSVAITGVSITSYEAAYDYCGLYYAQS